MALAAKIDIERGSKSLLAFDLGGPDAGSLRRLLGEIRLHTGLDVSVDEWAPRLPR